MHITTSQSVSQFRRGPHALTYTNVDRIRRQDGALCAPLPSDPARLGATIYDHETRHLMFTRPIDLARCRDVSDM